MTGTVRARSGGGGGGGQGRAGSRVENTTNTALTVDRLELNVDYKFLVRAYTSKGPGPWSNRLSFHTVGPCECDMSSPSLPSSSIVSSSLSDKHELEGHSLECVPPPKAKN